MPFDYKKEYPEYYLPPRTPGVIDVPAMNFLAVRGAGDPNAEGGAYQDALNTLYTLAFTLKMSDRAGHAIAGAFPYVVPPLEGFWFQEGVDGMDYARKKDFSWLSVIRLPDFVTRADFDWAVSEALRKKKRDCSNAEFLPLTEGLCVQCLHIGPYDDEPETVAAMDAFCAQNGLLPDFSDTRLHHEIYLGDPRRTAPEKRKTVLRHPVKRA